jgi:ABC-type antimicrobial peptide transport system permease subunit
MTIVGVVPDVKHFGLDKPEQPAAYDVYAQTGQPWKRWMTVVLRSPLPPAEVLRAAKERLWSLDGRIPPTQVRTMTQVMAASLDMHRFSLTLMSLFAAVALVLAAIGLYGVTAYGVTQRVHEFGIRMALGARRGDISRLVLGEGGRLVALGAVLGGAAALGLTRLMASLVVGVSVRDPLIFAGVALLLAVVAALACWLPAHRAGRVEPMIALRNE